MRRLAWLLLLVAPAANTISVESPDGMTTQLADRPPTKFIINDRWIMGCLGTDPNTNIYICTFHDLRGVKKQ